MSRALTCLCSLLIVLAACGRFPDLDGAISDRVRNAEFPRFMPMDLLLGTAFAGAESSQAEGASLAARAARLRIRVEAMRRPVVDRRTRARMAAALKRHAG
ncbi:MAG: hypothetical protein ACU0DI_09600 [Paracoccaceae bacterium]